MLAGTKRWCATGPGGMNVFDRRAKRLQKNRAAMAPDAATYDYIRDEVCVAVKLGSRMGPGLLFLGSGGRRVWEQQGCY